MNRTTLHDMRSALNSLSMGIEILAFNHGVLIDPVVLEILRRNVSELLLITEREFESLADETDAAAKKIEDEYHAEH